VALPDGRFEHPGLENVATSHRHHLGPAPRQEQSSVIGQINVASSSTPRESSATSRTDAICDFPYGFLLSEIVDHLGIHAAVNRRLKQTEEDHA
jgi:hypothetical protein